MCLVTKKRKKNLEYYLKLKYKIIIEPIIDEYGTEYMAYCNELGKYSCYGVGKTYTKAMKSFLKEKEEFIRLLYNRNKNIPEPEKEEEIIL